MHIFDIYKDAPDHSRTVLETVRSIDAFAVLQYATAKYGAQGFTGVLGNPFRETEDETALLPVIHYAPQAGE